MPVDLKALPLEPAQIILCVVHDLCRRAGKHLLHPVVNDTLVEVSAAEVSYRQIAAPPVTGDSIANDLAVPASPTGAQRLQVRVPCFEVDGDLIAICDVGEL